ncbi:MAG: dethiobiotin synthase [Verrucomicrobiota bacterium]
MPTVFISANDTGSGKTWVTATLARLLLEKAATIQVVKVVETGIEESEAGDTEWIENQLVEHGSNIDGISFHRLLRYRRPMAPVQAAEFDGEALSFETAVDLFRELPPADWKLVEGAGGVAVPLENSRSPRDWGDFAQAIDATYVCLVVDDRLGAINQARLLAEFSTTRSLNAGWWLNQVVDSTPEDVLSVNRKTLATLDFPLWGCQSYQSLQPEIVEASWLN